jgi:hypothetical protein
MAQAISKSMFMAHSGGQDANKKKWQSGILTSDVRGEALKRKK